MEVNKVTHNAKLYCARFSKGNIKTAAGQAAPLAPKREAAGKHKKTGPRYGVAGEQTIVTGSVLFFVRQRKGKGAAFAKFTFNMQLPPVSG